MIPGGGFAGEGHAQLGRERFRELQHLDPVQ
jgi:hypothetical protein